MSDTIDSANNALKDTFNQLNNLPIDSVTAQKVVESTNSNNLALYLAAFAILLSVVLIIFKDKTLKNE